MLICTRSLSEALWEALSSAPANLQNGSAVLQLGFAAIFLVDVLDALKVFPRLGVDGGREQIQGRGRFFVVHLRRKWWCGCGGNGFLGGSCGEGGLLASARKPRQNSCRWTRQLLTTAFPWIAKSWCTICHKIVIRTVFCLGITSHRSTWYCTQSSPCMTHSIIFRKTFPWVERLMTYQHLGTAHSWATRLIVSWGPSLSVKNTRLHKAVLRTSPSKKLVTT